MHRLPETVLTKIYHTIWCRWQQWIKICMKYIQLEYRHNMGQLIHFLVEIQHFYFVVGNVFSFFRARTWTHNLRVHASCHIPCWNSDWLYPTFLMLTIPHTPTPPPPLCSPHTWVICWKLPTMSYDCDDDPMYTVFWYRWDKSCLCYLYIRQCILLWGFIRYR